MCKFSGVVLHFILIQKWKHRQGQQRANLIFLLKPCQFEQSLAEFPDVAIHIPS